MLLSRNGDDWWKSTITVECEACFLVFSRSVAAAAAVLCVPCRCLASSCSPADRCVGSNNPSLLPLPAYSFVGIASLLRFLILPACMVATCCVFLLRYMCDRLLLCRWHETRGGESNMRSIIGGRLPVALEHDSRRPLCMLTQRCPKRDKWVV